MPGRPGTRTLEMEEEEEAVAEKGRKAGADRAAGKEEAEAAKTAAANKSFPFSLGRCCGRRKIATKLLDLLSLHQEFRAAGVAGACEAPLGEVRSAHHRCELCLCCRRHCLLGKFGLPTIAANFDGLQKAQAANHYSEFY